MAAASEQSDEALLEEAESDSMDGATSSSRPLRTVRVCLIRQGRADEHVTRWRQIWPYKGLVAFNDETDAAAPWA
jgi:hypothetical protein